MRWYTGVNWVKLEWEMGRYWEMLEREMGRYLGMLVLNIAGEVDYMEVGIG